jgi:hypothetical protein
MRPSDLGREIAYTATHASALIAFLTFFLLLELAATAGLFGLWLLALVIPAVTRYLMLLLDARARGRDAGPPPIETFLWFGNVWSLFPVTHVLVIVYATYVLGSVFAAGVAYTFLLCYGLLLPATLSVLAISRSPLESLKPAAVIALIRRLGTTYLIAPAFVLTGAALVYGLGLLALPGPVREFVALYLAFATFTVTGGMLRPYALHREVSIPERPGADADIVGAALERGRSAALNHAYGFISRGNRGGGLAHIYGWLDDDPDPPGAWPWFFEQMLTWEDTDPALMFAQRYLGRLLAAGDDRAACKLLLRCRHVNEAFRPLPEHHELALRAAERCQQEELVNFLR